MYPIGGWPNIEMFFSPWAFCLSWKWHRSHDLSIIATNWGYLLWIFTSKIRPKIVESFIICSLFYWSFFWDCIVELCEIWFNLQLMGSIFAPFESKWRFMNCDTLWYTTAQLLLEISIGLPAYNTKGEKYPRTCSRNLLLGLRHHHLYRYSFYFFCQTLDWDLTFSFIKEGQKLFYLSLIVFLIEMLTHLKLIWK